MKTLRVMKVKPRACFSGKKTSIFSPPPRRIRRKPILVTKPSLPSDFVLTLAASFKGLDSKRAFMDVAISLVVLEFCGKGKLGGSLVRRTLGDELLELQIHLLHATRGGLEPDAELAGRLHAARKSGRLILIEVADEDHGHVLDDVLGESLVDVEGVE